MLWPLARWTPIQAWSASWRGSCANLDTSRAGTHYVAQPSPRTEVSLNVALAPVVRGRPRMAALLCPDRRRPRALRVAGDLPGPAHADGEACRAMGQAAGAAAQRRRERARPGEAHPGRLLARAHARHHLLGLLHPDPRHDRVFRQGDHRVVLPPASVEQPRLSDPARLFQP